ncbi:MAG: M50 family metallopeptidase [Gammaproteobacteria bacterium]|nr:M50 family metallopeptidase [Gammaproteobacteria bacterium]
MKTQHQFILFAIGAFILSNIPIVHWPFSWLETYFHEISHGLAAVLSGGSIERIVLHFNGSGLCYTKGGWQPLVTFAGYTGAVAWGAIIYIGARARETISRWLAVVVLGMILISGILYARDIITILIMFVISGTLYLSFRYVIGDIFPRFMEFAGIYVMVSAAQAPLDLIDGRHYGDGATLANVTWLPEIIWVLIWSGIAIGSMVLLWRQQKAPVTP